MLRDNLAGLIEPMVDRAGAHPLGDHHKAGQTGGCSRSTQVPIIALKRSWRKVFRWKTEQPTEKAKWSGFAVTTAAHDSRAVGTQYHSHRTIDPPMPQNIPAPKGRNLCTNGERRSPFHAEPRHGYIINALQPLGILVSILVIADLPVSILYGALAMSGQHDALALGCLVLGGTAWWYGLCRTAEKIATTVRVRWTRRKSQ
jgi:hypothetical protein